MSAIEVKNLRKRFSGREVLAGLDLSIEPGSIFGLLGRNGAGKTTLIRLLLGAGVLIAAAACLRAWTVADVS